MLDIGFLPDLQRILSYLPKQRTTLLFSATFSPEIKRLAGSYLQDPITIEVARPNATASTVEQRFFSWTTTTSAAPSTRCVKTARPQAGLHLRQQQARLRPPGAQPGARRPQDHRAARRQEPGRAPESPGGLQERRGGPAGVYRRGSARSGHQGRAGSVQFRRSVQRRGLRAPHRPHGARGRLGPGRHAGGQRRCAPGGRHREAHQEEDRAGAAGAAGRPPARPLQRRPPRLARGGRRRPPQRPASAAATERRTVPWCATPSSTSPTSPAPPTQRRGELGGGAQGGRGARQHLRQHQAPHRQPFQAPLKARCSVHGPPRQCRRSSPQRAPLPRRRPLAPRASRRPAARAPAASRPPPPRRTRPGHRSTARRSHPPRAPRHR